MSWTDERVTLLKKLWVEGRTAAEIAKELGGVTRNAVIGKAHRLKLSNRVSPIQQNKKPVAGKPVDRKGEKKAAQVIASAASSVSNDAGSPAVSTHREKLYALTDLGPRMCRWPVGDPREKAFGFCGDSCVSGLPYCAEHAKVAYQAATRSRILQAEAEQRDTEELSEDVGVLKKAVAS